MSKLFMSKTTGRKKMKKKLEKKNSVLTVLLVIVILLWAAPLWAGGGQEKGAEPAEGKTEASGETAETSTDSSKEEKKGYDNPIVVKETADSITALDYDGNEVNLTKRPKRVIVNYTSMLGLWYMAGGTAVARPDTRSGRGVPEEAMDIETTGHVASPNTEKIVSLQPDFVVLSGSMDAHRNVKEILDQNGVENIMLNYANYHDFVNVLDLFARIVGNENVVEKIVPSVEKEVKDIINQYKDRKEIKFLSLFASTRDVSAELNKAHTAHIAMMLGGKNIAEEGAPQRGQDRITFSMEHIVMRNPDVIFVTVMGNLPKVQEKMKEDLMSNQAWAGVEAVQNDRLHYLPSDLFLYKPNERFPEAFRLIADLMYQ